MFNLFQQNKRNYTGEVSFYGLHDFERKLLLDHERVVDYYGQNGFFIPNEHLLVRLIGTIATPLSYGDDQYLDVTQQRALYAARALKITSSIDPGVWWKGVFYHGSNERIVAYVDDVINPSEARAKWREITAVHVLEHPVSNFGMAIPDGKRRQQEVGLAVIAINVSLLMLKYRGFMLEQIERSVKEDKAIETTKQFVAKHVLPGMLKSQIDIAMFNRIVCQFYGEPYGKMIVPHAFPISDYSAIFDSVAAQVIKRFKGSDFPYEAYLQQFPSVFHDYPLLMPDIANTRQVWWTLFLTRLKAMGFLLDLGGQRGVRANGRDISQLKITAKLFKSSGEFNQAMPSNYDSVMRNFLRSALER